MNLRLLLYLMLVIALMDLFVVPGKLHLMSRSRVLLYEVLGTTIRYVNDTIIVHPTPHQPLQCDCVVRIRYLASESRSFWRTAPVSSFELPV